MSNQKIIFAIIVIVLTALTVSCNAQNTERYTFKNGSYDGIGKWHMGREIAHVMGFQGINWLERDSREKEENTSTLIKNMDIQSGDVIADIGAGSGYHVFKMAPLAKDGKIYAVDIQPEMLAAIKEKKKEREINNIKLVKGSEQSSNLSENSIDKVLMVDVYHEFNFPYEVMKTVVEALKPNGEIFLIEYRAEDDNVPIKPLHKMTEKQAVKEMTALGLKLKKNIDNLPWQHCMVFVKE